MESNNQCRVWKYTYVVEFKVFHAVTNWFLNARLKHPEDQDCTRSSVIGFFRKEDYGQNTDPIIKGAVCIDSTHAVANGSQ